MEILSRKEESGTVAQYTNEKQRPDEKPNKKQVGIKYQTVKRTWGNEF